MDDPGWISRNTRAHAEISGMNFSIAARVGPAFSDTKRYTVWKPWLHHHEMLLPVQCPWTSRELYQAKFRLLAELRSWGTTFGRDEGLWLDIRMVIDELEMRMRELLAVAKSCPDELQVMLFVPSGVGEDSLIAKEIQEKVFLETGHRGRPGFAKGDGVATGWIGVPPVSKLRDIKYSWQSPVHTLGMRATSGHQIYTRHRNAGELAMRINMKVSDDVLAMCPCISKGVSLFEIADIMKNGFGITKSFST